MVVSMNAASVGCNWGCREAAPAKQNVVSMPKKKMMSATARRRIAAEQRARWAEFRAAKKAA
jgi:hypothetical protein